MLGVPEGPEGLMRDVSRGVAVPRPGVVTAAVGLLVLAAILWLPIAGSDPGITQAASLLLFLFILFTVRAGRGRRKARITVAVVTPLLVVMMLPYAWLGFTDPDYHGGPPYSVITIIAIICACTGLTLLFTRRSSAYVRARTAVLAAK